MSFRVSQEGDRAVLTGPKGDTLELVVYSDSSGVTWSGWTWAGQIRSRADDSLVGSFTITDSSTASVLNLACAVSAATTATMTVGQVYNFGIQGTKLGVVHTWVEGLVRITADVVQ